MDWNTDMSNIRHTIWIDRTTGTWGNTADLILVDPEIEGQHMDPEGGDDLTCISSLESFDSDFDIIRVAEDAYKNGHGMRLIALLQHYYQTR
jgi:hypothetical protein